MRSCHGSEKIPEEENWPLLSFSLSLKLGHERWAVNLSKDKNK